MASREYYTLPQEVWSVEQCKRLVKHVAKDGLGTEYPFPGYIGSNQPNGGGWGQVRFNGGCIHDGKWYDGTIRNLPVLPVGFKILTVPSWGFRIVECEVRDEEAKRISADKA